MNLKSTLFILLALSITFSSFAQNPTDGEVFRDDVVPRIDIFLPADSLAAIYDYNNLWSNHHYQATFIFDNGTIKDTLTNVGFRLRGNTSRQAGKKSFKVSFNTYVQGRKYYGLEKLNLNGEHNDPSIARAKIGWDLMREAGIPSPRANHVEVYINGSYYGLYINVEHIDEEFVASRFGNNDGNLFKCLYPADLVFISNNPNDYKQVQFGRRFYDLKTNTAQDDYSDLAHFIDVLNNTPSVNFACELEKVFNVDDYLKIMALDILIANWDGYIYNKNNFYLYHNTATDKFEYLPYDIDNTFGIDWYNIDWKSRDIYNWSNIDRPLYTEILAHQEYKDRFSYYMNDFITQLYGTTAHLGNIDNIKALIQTSAANDTYRTLDYNYTISDFNNSYTQSVGGHVKDGVKPFITARVSNALNQLVLNDIKPIIKDLTAAFVVPNQPIIIKAEVIDEAVDSVWVSYTINGGSPTQLQLFDDGQHNDEAANDGIYGLAINTTSNGTLEYKLIAKDDQAKVSQHPLCTLKSISIGLSAIQDLVINELMADNDTTIADNNGEYDDWIELYNKGNQPIALTNLYITDDFTNPTKYQLPDIALPPHEYVIIWADEDGNQGDTHANFKLSKNGEEVAIFDDLGLLVDSVTFGTQQQDVAFARLPNGTGNFQTAPYPTPGATNDFPLSTVVKNTEGYALYPNPASDFVILEWEHNFNINNQLTIVNQLGQVVYAKNNISNQYRWDLVSNTGASVSNGIYYINYQYFKNGNSHTLPTQKIVIAKK